MNCELVNHVSSMNPLEPTTYLKPVITFDVDWANDEVLADTIDLVARANASAVWFATHDTPLLKILMTNKKYEVGIHPNFNWLLQGDKRNGSTAEEVIERLLSIVPSAKSARSHSVTQSARLSEIYLHRGLTHESNDYIPAATGLTLQPWSMGNGLIKVPYFWSDELVCFKGWTATMAELTGRPGLKVFNFHPIHVFLNTENLDRYERTRPLHHKPNELIKHRYEGEGTRTRLLELLKLAGTISSSNVLPKV